ncbi:MAG: phosphotransferase family protein [Rhodospirillaceae bacterium]
MDLIAADEAPRFTALTGGVSSDIWRVDRRDGPICIKRALAKLRVARDWQAPVERGRYEVAYFETVAGIAPRAVPALLGVDPARQLFAMAYLDPARYRLWKAELRDGRADAAFAAAVGAVLAKIHAATAGRAEIAAAFPTDAIFHAIRLEPYLETTAALHPALAERILAVAHDTAATRRALVHGDVSPKNILVGPDGPVFLDAECAWYGDPAFDLAFCLNHMLLKCLWVPRAAAGFLACFDALAGAYLDGVDWEPRAAIDARVAALLPCLFLARVDGKSPVEYLTEDADKERVRRAARPLILTPPPGVAAVRSAWARELGIG